LPVTRAALLDSWQTVYKTPAPPDLATAMGSGG